MEGVTRAARVRAREGRRPDSLWRSGPRTTETVAVDACIAHDRVAEKEDGSAGAADGEEALLTGRASTRRR